MLHTVDQEKIELYKLLYKAQVGFDMIVDCLEEKDYEMAMLIASRICLGYVPPQPTEKDITNESQLQR